MKRTIEVDPTVDELAEAFLDLDAERQVDFLVAVARMLGDLGARRRDTQNLSIAAELKAAEGIALAMVLVWAGVET